MRPCTRRIASAVDVIKATSLNHVLVEHAPWCRTTPAALLIHIKPPDDGEAQKLVVGIRGRSGFAVEPCMGSEVAARRDPDHDRSGVPVSGVPRLEHECLF